MFYFNVDWYAHSTGLGFHPHEKRNTCACKYEISHVTCHLHVVSHRASGYVAGTGTLPQADLPRRIVSFTTLLAPFVSWKPFLSALCEGCGLQWCLCSFLCFSLLFLYLLMQNESTPSWKVLFYTCFWKIQKVNRKNFFVVPSLEYSLKLMWSFWLLQAVFLIRASNISLATCNNCLI